MVRQLAVPLMAICIAANATLANSSAKGDSLEVAKLLEIGENIIFGRDLGSAVEFTGAGSRLITSSQSVSLRDILAGADKSMKFSEDSTTRHLSRIAMETNEIEDAGILQLVTADRQSKNPRYHVIFLLKNKQHKWIIAVWRAPD